jgi:hypothetical protein
MFFWLNDDRVKLSAMIRYAAGNARGESEADTRKSKTQKPLRREIPKNHFFTALQETLDLLV